MTSCDIMFLFISSISCLLFIIPISCCSVLSQQFVFMKSTSLHASYGQALNPIDIVTSPRETTPAFGKEKKKHLWDVWRRWLWGLPLEKWKKCKALSVTRTHKCFLSQIVWKCGSQQLKASKRIHFNHFLAEYVNGMNQHVAWLLCVRR